MGLNTNASCHEVLLQNEQWFRRPEDGYARRKGGGQHSVTNDQGVWLVFLLAPEDCSSVSTFKGVCSILEESRPLLFLLENVDGMETKSAKDSEEVPSAVPVGLSWKLKLDWIWIVFFLNALYWVCGVLSFAMVIQAFWLSRHDSWLMTVKTTSHTRCMDSDKLRPLQKVFFQIVQTQHVLQYYSFAMNWAADTVT